MKKLHGLAVLIFTLAVMATAAEIPAKMSFLMGDVEINRNNVITKATLNMPLRVGDIVTTKSESYCEIEFPDESLLRVEANSSMKIEVKEKSTKRSLTRLFVFMGEIVAKVAKLGKRDVYEVRTNSAQAFVRGTLFKLKVEQDGSSLFSIFEGKLGVKSLVAGAKEMLMNTNFQGKVAVGQLTPLVEKIAPQELQKFQQRFKDFLDRSALFEKALKELEKKLKDKDYIKKTKKSCLF